VTDRLVKVLENGRLVARGLSLISTGAALMLDEDETLSVTIDWSGWLDTDTISSVTNEVESVSVSSESNTTTQASFSVSGSPGIIQHRITTAAGNIKELKLCINSPYVTTSSDYGFIQPMWNS
jgi:hypothetical protein